MKRLPILLLTLLLALTLSACYTVPPESADSSPRPTAEPTVEPTPEATAEPTSEPTAEPTPEPTAEPTASPESTAAPARGGQTLEELEESVEINLGQDVKDRPEVLDDDLKEIIYGSAYSYMRYIFTEMEENGKSPPELLDFECTELWLKDISDDGSVFFYSAIFDFLPRTETDLDFWMAGNTGPVDDREGWYHFSRQIAIKRDGKSWEIWDVGTGGMSIDDLVRKVELNNL